ncbi:MAG TPA: SDR family oxidoreductase [Gammaproteobacteria bacterium]|jgi:3-oxoacyl-[acyl-carrier protein] reductase|nr:3-oxoacyl-ACP reductase [Gammaproteobacteria bacterium]MBQ09027.1 3-oxoacyl-ACP reductase [Gammaproteobacteria bacterium]HJL80456.1 SDR family oxidoreductase [Gammaproteobacteria bacterium]HJM08824.1 SDR family oxidoreductase [Gammaproteobacteria bacterium]HJN00518.1 SDR family oxidoreductase [Gammaproteobacteria bacterium]|tara:strand:- start:7550 stop:8311 length:762 start_codon:yes stop_codon:yes gene_type:complete
MDIKGKTIIITGAARGLGAAMAKRLASHNCKLGLIDLDKNSIADTTSACEDAGAQVMCVSADVTKEDDVANAYAEVVDQMGPLVGSINNAGITRDGLLVKFKDGELVKRMSLEDWQAVIDINLTGVFLCGREAAQYMIEGGQGGVIINISSVARHGNFGQTNYSATKAGVQSMAVVWAKELSKYGIRVNSIAPGFINTEMVAGMPDNVKEKLSKMVPVGRIGEPDEVAQAAEFIFMNDYYSGRCVDLDGAQRM